MPSFAVALQSKLNRPEGILMLVEDRQIAEEVAAELRQRGRPVVVQEVRQSRTASQMSHPAGSGRNRQDGSLSPFGYGTDRQAEDT